jgi:hypothetical protein
MDANICFVWHGAGKETAEAKEERIFNLKTLVTNPTLREQDHLMRKPSTVYGISTSLSKGDAFVLYAYNTHSRRKTCGQESHHTRYLYVF